MTTPLTLWRVNKPTIGEQWLVRWTWGRHTGGLGTGVYAFLDEDAARTNAGRFGDADVYKIPNALSNPIRPRTLSATNALNRFSRMLDRIRASVQNGFVDLDAMIRETPQGLNQSEVNRRLRDLVSGGGYDVGDVHVPLNNTMIPGVSVKQRPDRDPRTFDTRGDTLRSVAWDILFETPELRDEYGHDGVQLARDGLKALQAALRDCPGHQDHPSSSTCLQPINHLLAPRWDGVAPTDGAGGNMGDHGCVIHATKQGNQLVAPLPQAIRR